MTQQISNPHDKLFKQLLGEPENAADFVANNFRTLDLREVRVTPLRLFSRGH
ncbi:Rpn family recombination-promoting nuclease/putative transposase [Desulfoferrobacter suflitae]|uniref:Rpn family recombination-promoting nuclease/putative transposase n=1 Tax=Desulfoferrobacter suflitae TaxID=2865782 RepID=UPI00338EA992